MEKVFLYDCTKCTNKKQINNELVCIGVLHDEEYRRYSYDKINNRVTWKCQMYEERNLNDIPNFK